jgi:hypothetical protein
LTYEREKFNGHASKEEYGRAGGRLGRQARQALYRSIHQACSV